MSEEIKAPSRLSSARVGSAKNKETEPVNRAQSARLSNENETAEKVEKIDPTPVENATGNEVENNEQESLKLELNQLEGEVDNQQKTNRSQLNSARSVKKESKENPEQNQNEGQITNRSTKGEGDEKKSARNTERKEEEEKKERVSSSRSETRQPSARN